MRAWLSRNKPALMLAVLSPAIAEVLSGSTPVSLLFFAPLSFFFFFAVLMLFYGGGALLIREATVRWKRGWPSVLLLGAAYGIVEEGFAVHTFFQSSGNPVNALGSYGHFAGVNTLWAVGLTVFHAVYSIALPILLVELAYPSSQGRSFLDRRAFVLTALGFVTVVGLFAVSTPSAPSIALFGVFAAFVGSLVVLARRAPPRMFAVRTGPPTAARWAFAAAGAGFLLDWVVVGLGAPGWIPSPALAIALFVVIGVGLLLFVLRYAGTVGTELSKYWFAAGMIGVFFGWDLILEFILVPGILLVSAAFAVYLYWLHRRVFPVNPPPPVPVGAFGRGTTP